MYRFVDSETQVLLVHPGGPLWSKKDAGVWSIPKGEYDQGEIPIHAAKREFYEETGHEVGDGEAIELKPVKQKSGKVVTAYAIQGDLDPSTIKSNTFSMEWPPKSGRQQSFAEIDRAEWFVLAEARQKINPAQSALLDELEKKLSE